MTNSLSMTYLGELSSRTSSRRSDLEKLFITKKPVPQRIVQRNKELKSYAIDWCKSTSHHGFGNIVRTEIIPLKIMWVIAIVVSVGYLSYCKYFYYSHV